MGGHGGVDAGTFSRELAALKQRGCNVLLVGEAGRPATRATCDRLLGGDGGPPRRRVVVATDAAGPLDHLLDDVPAEHTTLIRRRTQTRGAAIDRPVPTPSPATVTVVEESLDVLGRAILLAIDEHASADPDPAMLRLCVDGLGPLLAKHEVADVSAFVEGLFDRVAEANGMGHAHLRVPLDHDAVGELRPPFDVVVELRPGDPPEQRWHLDDADLVTDWLALEEA